MVNGSLDLAARAIAQYPFLFHLAIQGAAQKLALRRQMNRARGWSVVRRSKETEQCDYVVTRVRIYLGRIFGAATPLRALVCAVVNGSLDLAARAIVLQAFLFDEAKFVAA